MTEEKRAVERYIESIEGELFGGDVSTIINNLIALEEKYPQWGRLNIHVTRGYEDGWEFSLYGKRIETDEEFAKRTEKNKKAKERANTSEISVVDDIQLMYLREELASRFDQMPHPYEIADEVMNIVRPYLRTTESVFIPDYAAAFKAYMTHFDEGTQRFKQGLIMEHVKLVVDAALASTREPVVGNDDTQLPYGEQMARYGAVYTPSKEQPDELPQIERGTVEHLVKREIPRLLLIIAECVDDEGCEMLIEREHYRDIEFTLTDAMKQLQSLSAAKKRESGKPAAMRYGWDGNGYRYIDNASGSDWLTRNPEGEYLYTHPASPYCHNYVNGRCEFCREKIEDYVRSDRIKWEYSSEILGAHEDRTKFLERYGLHGWRLCAVSKYRFYFTREVINQIEGGSP